MSTFIDRHPFDTVPRAARLRLRQEVRQGFIDPRGVQALGHWANDGVIYCLVDAPDADAVSQHHATRGIPCDDLHQIDSLDECWPLSHSAQDQVGAAIKARWPTDDATQP